MLIVDTIKNSLYGELSYVVSYDNSKNCLIIDPGSDYEKIQEIISHRGLKISGVLITHGHFDHIMSCKKFQGIGAKIYISKLDADKCESNELCLAEESGYNIDVFTPDVLIDENEDYLSIENFNIRVLHLKGHSKGGLGYIIDDNIFTGDTLFENGYGRYDFYDGNFSELMHSLKMVLGIIKKEKLILRPGH